MPDTPAVEDKPEAARLIEQAERVRASGVLRRSTTLQRLFDYLVECSVEGRAPKEIEIADRVFGKGGDSETLVDASVRVNVHRLRRKLHDFYAGTTDGERLALPRGGYRLVLVSPEAAADADAEGEGDALAPGGAGRLRLALAALLVLALAGWGLASWQAMRSPPAAEAASLEPWARISNEDRPTIIAVGDYYIFGETSEEGVPERLVREFAINSPRDLDTYLKEHPGDVPRYRDIGLSYLPVGAAPALRALLPVIEAATGGGTGTVRVVPMSEVTPPLLKNANIVYVGLLSGLGPLRRPVFGASRLRVGSSYDELIDTVNGRRYVADAPAAEGAQAGRIDYAYIAAFRAPAGNHMLIVAGTRDAALVQAAEIAAAPDALAKIARQDAGGASFEALYEVAALGNLNLSNRLIFAGRRGDVRLGSRSGEAFFPDDISAAQP